MLSSLVRAQVRAASSFSAKGAKAFKVSVIGAAGGIGAPLSLLLKQNPLISHLSLYDLAPVTPGVGADLSHINTRAKVVAYTGKDIYSALKGADVVVVPAGMARKPGMTRDDLFRYCAASNLQRSRAALFCLCGCSTNASIIADIAKAVGEAAPDSILLVISNPVNSTLPICAEVLKALGVYNKSKLFGVTTLDIVRANTFVAEHQGWDVRDTHVPVVCGHSGVTILPLLSQVANAKFSDADKDAITQRIQTAGDLVVKAKAGGGSATLSMAFAGAQFTDSVLRAMSGEKGIIECTFVESEVQPGLPYFSSRVELGPNGVEKIYGLGQLDAYEAQKLEDALPELKASINKGIQFVHGISMSKL